MKPTYSELFERVNALEDRVKELNYDCDAKDEEIDKLESDIEKLEEDLEKKEGELDKSTLDKQMMFDWIKEHWNELRLEDLKCLVS